MVEWRAGVHEQLHIGGELIACVCYGSGGLIAAGVVIQLDYGSARVCCLGRKVRRVLLSS